MSRGRAGQALVEFALLAGVLLLLAVLVWDGATAFRQDAIVRDAARAGARVAASGYGASIPAEAVERAARAAAQDAPATLVGVEVSYPDAESVEVGVTAEQELYTPVLRQAWTGGSGRLRLERRARFFLPRETPVPPTIQPSTPPPTQTPLPRATPTPSPTPGLCTTQVSIPPLDRNTGWYVTFQTAATGPITATWTLPARNNVELDLYSGNPFEGQPNPTSLRPPANPLASDAGNVTSLSVSVPSAPAGLYSAYFYNFGAPVGAASQGTLAYLAAGCP